MSLCLPSWADALAPGDLAALRLLTLQFYARLNPGSTRFLWPDNRTLLRIQGVLPSACHLQTSQSPELAGDAAYAGRFLKCLVEKLEKAVAIEVKEGQEDEEVVDDRIYDALAALMVRRDSIVDKPASQTVTHFIPMTNGCRWTDDGESSRTHPLFPGWRPITITEAGTTIAHGTTGLRTWEASLRLAEHLAAETSQLQQCRTIVELGCGTGFLGALASHLQNDQNTQIILTDLDGQVLKRTHRTLEDNLTDHERERVTLQPLDWLDVRDGDHAACSLLHAFRAEMVLATDVVFDPDLIDPLACVLERTLRSGSCQNSDRAPFALVASTIRNHETFSAFCDTLDRRKLRHEEVPLKTASYNLTTLKKSSSTADDEGANMHYRLFPSLHHEETDGVVRVLGISLV